MSKSAALRVLGIAAHHVPWAPKLAFRLRRAAGTALPLPRPHTRHAHLQRHPAFTHSAGNDLPSAIPLRTTSNGAARLAHYRCAGAQRIASIRR